MQEEIKNRYNEITHIQNTIWKMYKDFLEDHDMRKYNQGMKELVEEYCEKDDQQLLAFCQWSFITWAPVINGLAEYFRKNQE